MTRKEKIDFLKENFNGIGPAKAEKIADLFHDVDNLVTLAYNKEAYVVEGLPETADVN